ncbi:unnamed protein product [Nippostrongylus brasiliensis]|uniref:Uncharacterized protein n=1 Tax=Nippostrongylus brasiliensis TaxID=27835 RepID=A0A3P7ABT4_NIPBR|nr:unnamed protein product [Nippostrongylus brasiliensis]
MNRKFFSEVDYWSADERCFGCYEDVRCFAETIHRVLVDLQSGTLTAPTGQAEYYIAHFAPQVWWCHFDFFKRDYTLVTYHRGINGTQETAAEMDEIFAAENVPTEQRTYIHTELLKGKSRHSTRGSKDVERVMSQIMKDPYILDILRRMYLHDFIEFGFR